MAADTIIDVVLQIQDKLTPGIDKAMNGVQKFEKSNTKIKDTLQGVGVASAAVSVGIAAVMGDAAKSAIDAESAFLELNKQLGLSDKEFKAVSTQISSMGASMGLSVTQSANLGAEVAKAGLSGEKLNQTFKDIQESSVALSIDTEKMTDKYLQMYATFGDNTKKMMQDVNILADNSATGAQQIIDAFAGISPIVKQFGLDTKNVMAEMTVALEKGFDPSRVQNAYKDLMLTLSRGYGELPTKANEALDEIYDGQGTMLNTIWHSQGAEAALKDFKSRLANIKDEGARINLIQSVFGTNYASEMAAILGNVETVQKYTGLIADDGKNAAAFAKEFDRQSGTTAHQAKVLAANWDMLKITIGQAILPALNDIMKVVTPMIKSFAEWAAKNPELVKMGVTIAGIVAAATGLLAVVAMIGAGLAGLGTVGAMFAGIGGAIAAVGTGIVAVAASPALLVAAIVAAVAAIVYLVVTNWETVKKVSSMALSAILEYFKNYASFMLKAWDFVLNGLYSIFEGIFKAIVSGIKMYFEFIFGLVKNTFNGIVGFFTTFYQTIFNGLKTFFVTIFETVKTFFTNVVNGYIAFWTTIYEGLKSFFQSVITAYQTAFNAIVNAVGTFFTTVVTAVQTGFTTIVTAVQTAFTTIVTAVQTGFTTIVTAVQTAFTTVVTAVQTAFNTIVTTVTTFFQNFINAFTQGFEQLKTLVTTSMEAVKQAFMQGLEAIKQAFNNTGAFFEGIKQTITGFIDFLKNVFQGGLDFLKTVVEGGLGIIKGIFESIVNFLIDLLKHFALSGGQSGADLMRNMADGINNNSHLVESAMKNATAKADSYMPHSPSKKGAFSRLDETGFGLMDTFANGIRQYDLSGVMGNMAQSGRSFLSDPVGMSFMPEASPSTGQTGSQTASIVINYSPVINGGNSETIIDQLKKNERVLIDLIQKATKKTDRKLY